MTRKQFHFTLVIVMVAALSGGAAFQWLKGELSGPPVQAAEETVKLDIAEIGRSSNERGEQILGIVQDGRFRPLVPERPLGRPARLTAIKMYEAIAPEAGELDLTDYEGRAIMVRGRNGGGWIYSAAVVDSAGPILTTVVKRVFAERNKEKSEGHASSAAD